MTSLFDVGKSALNSYRQSLAVTGQNIANINTEGYKKRQANLEEVTGSQGSVTSLANQTGLGSALPISNARLINICLTVRVPRHPVLKNWTLMLTKVKQLENMLLPDQGSLGEQIANFFDSLREVSAAPSELAARAVAIEQGKALAQVLTAIPSGWKSCKQGIKSVMEDSVASVNMLAQQLADVNGRILATGQSGQSPNSIYDLRDRPDYH